VEQRTEAWVKRCRQCFMMAGLAAMVAAAGGCAAESPDERSTYRRDGYLGYTNTNPNMMNRGATQLSYGPDVRLVRQVLEPVEGIRHLRISFNGGELHVRVQGESHLTDQELVRLRAEVQQIVQHNMPRYEVHVTTVR
jgi:hypothetical protein